MMKESAVRTGQILIETSQASFPDINSVLDTGSTLDAQKSAV
jgi:hypothetical protein